jgi:hypothetical protein
MDITRGEQVEAELDALIRRRHDQRVLSEGERRSSDKSRWTDTTPAAERRTA